MFEYSFAAIMRLRPEVLRKLRIVKFEGEDVLDYGGISREWSFHLLQEIFNPCYVLCTISIRCKFTQPPASARITLIISNS